MDKKAAIACQTIILINDFIFFLLLKALLLHILSLFIERLAELKCIITYGVNFYLNVSAFV